MAKTEQRGALVPSMWVPVLQARGSEFMGRHLQDVALLLIMQYLGWRAESVLTIKMSAVTLTEDVLWLNAGSIKCGR